MQLAVPGAKQKTIQPCRFLYKCRLFILIASDNEAESTV